MPLNFTLLVERARLFPPGPGEDIDPIFYGNTVFGGLLFLFDLFVIDEDWSFLATFMVHILFYGAWLIGEWAQIFEI